MMRLVVVGKDKTMLRVSRFLGTLDDLEATGEVLAAAHALAPEEYDLMIFPYQSHQGKRRSLTYFQDNPEFREIMLFILAEGDRDAEIGLVKRGVSRDHIIPAPSRIEGDLPPDPSYFLELAIERSRPGVKPLKPVVDPTPQEKEVTLTPVPRDPIPVWVRLVTRVIDILPSVASAVTS